MSGRVSVLHISNIVHIVLSFVTHSLKMPDTVVISDTEDEEEDVLQAERDARAKRARRQAGTTSGRDVEAVASTSTTQQQGPDTASSSLSGLFGNANERKQLELARRARQKERRRAQGLPSDSENEGEQSVSQNNRPVRTLPSSAGSQERPSAMTAGPRPTSGQSPDREPKSALKRILASDRFYDGVVKRSYNRYTSDGVPFSDFILPTTNKDSAGLKHALVGSYVYDFEWLKSVLPDQTASPAGGTSSAPPTLTFIAPQGGTADQKLKEGAIYATQTPGWELLGIKDIGREYVCQHMKFMFLFYSDRFRLVILTGNLIAYDWETLENAAYIQDFPLLPGSQKDDKSDTYVQLSSVMKSLSVPYVHPALKDLSRYDLKKGPTIVASSATPSNAPKKGFEQISQWGVGRLAECARQIMGGTVKKGGVKLEAQGSSMGSYSVRWMQQIHLAACGLDLSSCLPLPSSAIQSRKVYNKYTGNSNDDFWPPVKLLFPTKNFVEQESSAGPNGAGCHFGKPTKFQQFAELCHHATAARHHGLLMHQKGLLALRDGTDGGEEGSSSKPQGWIYMGSANFTMNAWGNISAPPKSSSSSTPQMIMNNWELGIILPVYAKDLTLEAELSSMAASCVCWKRPPERYGEGDVPWSPVQ